MLNSGGAGRVNQIKVLDRINFNILKTMQVLQLFFWETELPSQIQSRGLRKG